MTEFDIENEIRKVAENTEVLRGQNGSGRKPVFLPTPVPMQPDERRYDFENVGEQIAAAMVQAAEEQLVQAQNMLEQTKRSLRTSMPVSATRPRSWPT